MSAIPKILHYVFLSDPDAREQKPWSLVHYVCVRSAVERIRPDQVYLHCNHEPSGPWWALTKPLMTLAKVDAPREIFGNPLVHPAHQADVVRLDVLRREGGIYLDLDVFVQRDFDPLLDETSVVMGLEGVDGVHGTANAVLLARPGARFLDRWYEEYRWFRGRGREIHWNEHSVQLPWQLAQRHPSEITLLDEKAFFWPLWTDDQIGLIFEPQDADVDPRSTYANHLWESTAWDRHLHGLTPGRVRAVESPFHRWIRPMLSDLPDDYGLSKAQPRPVPPARWQGASSTARSRTTALLASAKMPAKRAAAHVLGDALATRFKATLQRLLLSPRRWRENAELEQMYALLRQLPREGKAGLTVVDLDCADIAPVLRLLAAMPDLTFLCCSRDGERIQRLARTVMDSRLSFRVLDMAADPLPAADACLVRQGLSHRPAAERAPVLQKLAAYRCVYLAGEPSAVADPHGSLASRTPVPPGEPDGGRSEPPPGDGRPRRIASLASPL